MSYESRLYIMDRSVIERGPHWDAYVYAQKIATIDMSSTPEGFVDLFNEPIDYTIFVDGENDTDEDMYGDHLKYTSIENVIGWIKNELKQDGYYRRLMPLLGLLQGFDPEDWHELQIVHFGY